jgi:hypothetical protein
LNSVNIPTNNASIPPPLIPPGGWWLMFNVQCSMLNVYWTFTKNTWG